ncbi:glycoside hydrolase family 3 C-terminal domain-containing protein [Nguyenibacter vanlangensis]|uniref:Glycoside hydrolase family 3 C-terminal domain-containing protein n=1 Tax=Nguyenibacter vanlangensis TaxID=1216886 RepID=A0ABZ3D7P9_9PROT
MPDRTAAFRDVSATADGVCGRGGAAGGARMGWIGRWATAAGLVTGLAVTAAWGAGRDVAQEGAQGSGQETAREIDRPSRVAALAARLTPAEKLALVQAVVGRAPDGETDIVTLPGVPRVGLPALRMAVPDGRDLPSPLALMAGWDTGLARRVGLAHARAARAAGHALVPLEGVGPVSAGLARDGEDPLLSGWMMGAVASGLLAGHVVPLFGGQDVAAGAAPGGGQVGRMSADRMLGLYLAVARARGAGILCRSPGVGEPGCGGLDFHAIRDGWRFGGLVAALTGGRGAGPAVPGQAGQDLAARAVLAEGIDLVGAPEGAANPYGGPLRRAVGAGAVQAARLDRMADHILLPLDQAGVIERPPPFIASGRGARTPRDPLLDEEVGEGAVLLQNENGVLPLGGTAAHPLVIVGAGNTHDAARALAAAIGQAGIGVRLAADSPDAAHLPKDVAQAERVVILSDGAGGAAGDDRLISAIAEAGGHVVVVLLSDDPDRPMPWLDLVDGVVQAWAWRGGGQDALAALLTGARDFAGRLPATFTGGQTPAQLTISCYKAFDRAHVAPLFPFGYGLSLRAQFSYGGLRVTRDGTRLVVSFDVANDGSGAGRDVPQIYLDLPAGVGDAPKRLIGWRSVQLAPGQQAHLSLGIDAHLLGQWNPGGLEWVVPAGDYAVSLGGHSANLVRQATIHLPELRVPAALGDGAEAAE